MELIYKIGKRPENPDLYYNIAKDIKDYPEAIIFICFGGRFTGKTFSSLKYCIENDLKFIFMKRTNDDVDQLINTSSNNENCDDINLDPMADLNTTYVDLNYKPVKLSSGFGAYYQFEDDKPTGDVKGYIMSLNKVAKYKGMGALKDCDIIIFDEFVPTQYQIVKRGEGQALLDLYLTVTRDREIRGLSPIKLICLANADNVVSPTSEELNITDIVANMETTGQSIHYIEDRYILIHKIIDNKELMKKQAKTKIYQTMSGTSWADMSLGNKFAYNDFSDIQRKMRMKNYKAIAKFKYKNVLYFIYQHLETGDIYICNNRSTLDIPEYNLKIESQQSKFYYDFVLDILDAWAEGQCKFNSYSIKYLFRNYKKIYNI